MKKFEKIVKSLNKFGASCLALALLTSIATLGKISADEKKLIRIGVSPSPHAEIIEQIKGELEEKGIKIEVQEFTDYNTPNLALAEGDIDANYFQHIPFFDDFKEKENLDLEILCGVHIEPMGIYSEKHKSLDELEDGAEIFIPEDTVNGARALALLQANGIITLKEDAGLEATERDIVDNPKNIKITALEAATLAQTYGDADFAVINGNYAIQNGLNPLKDSLALENEKSPYTNIIAVRTGDAKKEEFQALKEALQSEKVKDFIEKKYEGAVVYAAYDPDKDDKVSEESSASDSKNSESTDKENK